MLECLVSRGLMGSISNYHLTGGEWICRCGSSKMILSITPDGSKLQLQLTDPVSFTVDRKCSMKETVSFSRSLGRLAITPQHPLFLLATDGLEKPPSTLYIDFTTSTKNLLGFTLNRHYHFPNKVIF